MFCNFEFIYCQMNIEHQFVSIKETPCSSKRVPLCLKKIIHFADLPVIEDLSKVKNFQSYRQDIEKKSSHKNESFVTKFSAGVPDP